VMLGVAATVVVVIAITAQSGGKSVAPRAATAPVETQVPNEPLAGFGFSAVYDPSVDQLVLFGGIDSYGTTWLWDGRRWSLAHPTVSPPGRFAAAAAYDPVRRLVMLYGGRLGPGDVVDDTWGWDGRTWRELDGGTGSPPAGEGSVMAWDDVLSEMVLLTPDGETWLWNGNQWMRQPRGHLPVFGVGMAVDPVTRTLLTASCCAPGQTTSSTWGWDGSQWHQVSTRANPPAIVGLALDPATDKLLLCSDPTAAGVGRQMWSWSGTDWIAMRGSRLPVVPEAEVTDIDDGHLLVLSSLVQSTQGSPQPIHVWSWNGSTWNRLG
jgi:hypothetical protein